MITIKEACKIILERLPDYYIYLANEGPECYSFITEKKGSKHLTGSGIQVFDTVN